MKIFSNFIQLIFIMLFSQINQNCQASKQLYSLNLLFKKESLAFKYGRQVFWASIIRILMYNVNFLCLLFLKINKYQKKQRYLSQAIMIHHNHSCFDDYALISVIGKGNYAKVVLVRNKHDQKVYAMKVLKKKMILQMNQTEHIMNEKTILANISNPFLVNLKATFQDQKKLYFVLEYCPGGELFGLLTVKDRLNQQQTKFFATQILLALEELHAKGVIYRDLKPQNVLLDKNGYIKLTDFGLSKLIRYEDELTMSICGTPQYLAPQILQNKGHGLAVDWWCLGCIIYEMVTGYPPFKNQNRMGLFNDIKYKGFKMPEVSDKMKGLFYGLLQKNPKKRLGSKGAAQVKQHPFFEKVNWTGIKAKNIKAPFVPILSSDSDISNFDPQFTSCTVQSYSQSKDSTMDVQINQECFADFEFQEEQ